MTKGGELVEQIENRRRRWMRRRVSRSRHVGQALCDQQPQPPRIGRKPSGGKTRNTVAVVCLEIGEAKIRAARTAVMRGLSRKWVWRWAADSTPAGFAIGLAEMAVGGPGDQPADRVIVLHLVSRAENASGASVRDACSVVKRAPVVWLARRRHAAASRRSAPWLPRSNGRRPPCRVRRTPGRRPRCWHLRRHRGRLDRGRRAD